MMMFLYSVVFIIASLQVIKITFKFNEINRSATHTTKLISF